MDGLEFDMDRHLEGAMAANAGNSPEPGNAGGGDPAATPPDGGDVGGGTQTPPATDPQQTGEGVQQQQQAGGEPPAATIGPLEPPQHWPKEQQEKFKALPPEGQQVLLDQARWLETGAQEKFSAAAALRREVAGILERLALQQQGQQQPAPPEEEETPPVDPIERVQWETEKRVLKRVEDTLTSERIRDTQTSILKRAKEIKTAVAQDPLRGEVMKAINEWIMIQPTEIDPMDPHGRTFQEIEAARLNDNPEYYFAKYRQARSLVINQLESMKRGNGQGQPTPPAGQQSNANPQQTPPASTSRAPSLEGSGGDVGGGQKGPSEEAAKLLKQIRSGKARPDTLDKYLAAIDIKF